jgi:hypothetical protein
MACMQVTDLQHDALEFRTRIALGLQEPHYPHVVCVVVNDEYAIEEAMWGWDIHMDTYVLG